MTYQHRSPKRDIYQTVTDKIVASIERGAGNWSFPWSRQSVIPVNAVGGPLPYATI